MSQVKKDLVGRDSHVLMTKIFLLVVDKIVWEVSGVAVSEASCYDVIEKIFLSGSFTYFLYFLSTGC